MVEHRKPIPVSEAVQKAIERARMMGIETVPLERSYNRILAEPVIAGHPVPPFDRSPYDGFAIISAQSAGASGDQRIQFDAMRSGSALGQNAVLGKELGKG